MYYLGIDTSNKFLIVSIFNDEAVLYFKQTITKRNASELANVDIKEAFDTLKILPKDLKAVVTTKGPGSFTGVKIAMSIAKVLANTLDIPLYSISSLLYYAGINSSQTILDARSSKVFEGRFKQGKIISEKLINISELVIEEDCVGDLSLVNKRDNYPNLTNNFLILKEFWTLESAITAKPSYLKTTI